MLLHLLCTSKYRHPFTSVLKIFLLLAGSILEKTKRL